jgi:hypothetical protein
MGEVVESVSKEIWLVFSCVESAESYENKPIPEN